MKNIQLGSRPGFLFVLVFSLIPFIACSENPQTSSGESLAPYYPTPEKIVEEMLKLAELKPGEVLFDLGSGDGRIVIMAAEKFGAKAFGVELDPDLVRYSREEIKKRGLEDRAKIIHGDLLQQDYSSADVVTVYLLPSAVEKLEPILEKQLKPGTRVVSHDYYFPSWEPEKEVELEDDDGRIHTLYLYRR